jgi:hypothetical protein
LKERVRFDPKSYNSGGRSWAPMKNSPAAIRMYFVEAIDFRGVEMSASKLSWFSA